MATPTNLPADFSPGQVLTAAQMDDLRGAFRVLQVKEHKVTSLVSTTSGSYVNTGLSVAITPQDTSSGILVLASHSTFCSSAGTFGWMRLNRSGTPIANFLDCIGGGNSSVASSFSFNYFDLPNTTSAVTYTTQVLRGGGAGSVQVNVNSNPATIIVAEISL
jgi:hypothetical protein